MKISGIYKIQSKIKPERCYIGSAVNIKRRHNEHISELRRNKHDNQRLQNHFNKYGESDLIFIIIEPCLPSFLTVREQYYIDILKPFFNILKIAGNTIGYKFPKEVIDRIQKTRRENNYTLSEGARKKISIANSGENHYLYGKHLSEQIKKNISKVNSGNKYCVGRVLSDETKRKISESLKGEKNFNYGKHFSEEHKRKIGEAQRGKPKNKKILNNAISV